MEITPRSKLNLRLQNLIFLTLFGTVIALLAWLSNYYVIQADWTFGSRNTLSPVSQKLLAHLPEPLYITAYARDNPSLHKGIRQLIGRYQRYKPDITLRFVNPDTAPDRVRELGISRDGELYLEYQGRSEQLQQLSEQGLSNALQRLSRSHQGTVLFLSGHGERKPHGQANHDLGNFGQQLTNTGLEVRELNLAREPEIPDAAVLVIASPQVALLPGEVDRVLNHLQRGGNLLWLVEPKTDVGLQALAQALGIRMLPGQIVDADGSLYGIDNPTFVLVVDYGPHPVTQDLQTLTLFPQATALETTPTNDWESQDLLLTQSRTWTETSPLSGTIRFDPDGLEKSGPLLLGVALSRPQQRVIVIGDGDFLSNAYLGNGGNPDLGLNLFNWLSEDDTLLDIRTKPAPDQELHLSDTALLVMTGVFLLGLPLLALSGSWLIWWRRQRR